MSVPPAPAVEAPALSESLRALAARGESRRYRKGTLLIQEGDFGDTMFVVLSGRVKAFSSDEREREIVYGVYGPGETLGEMSLDGGPRSASVITLEPSVCAVITRQRLREHIAANPEFALELLSQVIRRARFATQSARNMAMLDVYGRVAQTLNEVARPVALGSRAVAPRLTHQEIASRVGSSREMVSRILKDLVSGGYLVITADEMEICRPLPARW
jgi:CRP/FNR family transcriptional regulator, cyclic AMP receptor protein